MGAAGGGADGAAQDVPEATSGDTSLAGLWLGCHERVVAAAAHELNNALNGVAMNLEVVRLRARQGADAGALASFVAAAAEEHELTLALVSALLALGRSPRPVPGTDVAAVLGHAVAIFGPVLRHQGVTIEVSATERPARTGAPYRAVRLVVCTVIEGAAAALGSAGTRPEAEVAGGDLAGVLRCKLDGTDGPNLVVSPGPAAWTDEFRAALAGVGIRCTSGPDALRVAFPSE